jgi:prefoldin subunit 5
MSNRENIKLDKEIYFSDVRISDRLDEIDKWRKTLEYSIQDVDREIQAIQSAKEQCERYLEHMRSPLGKQFYS